MLAMARANAAVADVELDLREGDMRDLTVDEPAALIYCPYRALLHLHGWAGDLPGTRSSSTTTSP
jgi:hypothetical protein